MIEGKDYSDVLSMHSPVIEADCAYRQGDENTASIPISISDNRWNSITMLWHV